MKRERIAFALEAGDDVGEFRFAEVQVAVAGVGVGEADCGGVASAAVGVDLDPPDAHVGAELLARRVRPVPGFVQHVAAAVVVRRQVQAEAHPQVAGAGEIAQAEQERLVDAQIARRGDAIAEHDLLSADPVRAGVGAVAEEMRVGIDDPRHQCQALEIDDHGRRPGLGQDGGLVSDGDDSLALDVDGGSGRLGVIHGENHAVVEDDVGGRRSLGGRRRRGRRGGGRRRELDHRRCSRRGYRASTCREQQCGG